MSTELVNVDGVTVTRYAGPDSDRLVWGTRLCIQIVGHNGYVTMSEPTFVSLLTEIAPHVGLTVTPKEN